MSKRFLALAAFGGVLVLCGASGAAAQEETATGGYVSGFQKVVDEIPLPEGRMIRRMELELTVTADDPESPWHLGSQDCFATYTFAADGSLEGGRGLCDFVSPEGDLSWLTLEVHGSAPVEWHIHGDGTGKLAGIEHWGKTTSLAMWSDGRVISRWEGTMRRK